MAAKSITPITAETTIKRFLRHRGSRQYFKEGGWTRNPEDADNFADIVEVVQTCARYGLSDVELTVRFGSSDLFCTPIR